MPARTPNKPPVAAKAKAVKANAVKAKAAPKKAAPPRRPRRLVAVPEVPEPLQATPEEILGTLQLAYSQRLGENVRREAELKAMGGDPLGLMRGLLVRFDLLLDWLFPSPEQRLHFEIAYQDRLVPMLDEEIARASRTEAPAKTVNARRRR